MLIQAIFLRRGRPAAAPGFFALQWPFSAGDPSVWAAPGQNCVRLCSAQGSHIKKARPQGGGRVVPKLCVRKRIDISAETLYSKQVSILPSSQAVRQGTLTPPS